MRSLELVPVELCVCVLVDGHGVVRSRAREVLCVSAFVSKQATELAEKEGFVKFAEVVRTELPLLRHQVQCVCFQVVDGPADPCLYFFQMCQGAFRFNLLFENEDKFVLNVLDA